MDNVREMLFDVHRLRILRAATDGVLRKVHAESMFGRYDNGYLEEMGERKRDRDTTQAYVSGKG